MWTLWFVPLVALSFLVGLVVAVVWYLLRALAGKRPRIPVAAAVAVAVPSGCAALPIIALVLLAAVGSLFQKSDTELYEEVFGHEPALGEDRMLFNDSGSGADRQIFMRARPTDAEREKMLATAPLRASETTVDEFAALGTQRGFGWWIWSDPRIEDRCKSVRVREAHGFRGWREFLVAECLDGRTEWRPGMNTREVYVVAAGRP